jgi:UDP-glucose 4-epimerase
MATIVVTGSKGLIGKALCAALQQFSYSIKPFDINFPHAHPYYGDINDTESMHHHFENCDGIVHLAAVSRVVWGEQQPERCWQTNVEGTKNVLKIAASLPSKPWVIYASSREVYGQQQQLPVVETASLQPLNVYARSKVSAETLVSQYQYFGIKTAILRFSSVYGCIYDHADRVIPAFCSASALGKTLRIEGSNNTFDFTHVSDVVNGIVSTIKYMENNQPFPSALHLTSGKPTTLHKAAELARAAGNKNSTFMEATPRDFDVAAFIGDPSLAKQVLGWEAKIDIHSGIAQLVHDYRMAQSQVPI